MSIYQGGVRRRGVPATEKEAAEKNSIACRFKTVLVAGQMNARPLVKEDFREINFGLRRNRSGEGNLRGYPL